MNWLHIKSPDIVVSDTHISGIGWWADKYCLDFLPHYRGKWVVSLALPRGLAPTINFPAVMDDFGELVWAS